MVERYRRRMAEFERREAAGESVWTKEFTNPARIRLLALFEPSIGPANHAATHERAETIIRLLKLFGEVIPGRESELDRIKGSISIGDSDLLPSVLEAAMIVLRNEGFDASVKEILEEERIAYRLVDGRLIPFDSLEMHEAVVAPALRLLAGRADLNEVELAYQDALKEIGANPGDAITDAGRALQAMLTALGCTGNAIGAQVKDARRKNLLAPHDATLSSGIEKIIDWVSADRSEKGDAHKAAPVTPEDAWFTVHVVGALILRLAEGPRV